MGKNGNQKLGYESNNISLGIVLMNIGCTKDVCTSASEKDTHKLSQQEFYRQVTEKL